MRWNLIHQHIHNQPDDDLLVLGIRGGHQQSQRRQGVVVDPRFSVIAVEDAVFVQEKHEEIGADAFVSVAERVSFDDVVEEICRLLLYRG